jgi:hypothetical protein
VVIGVNLCDQVVLNVCPMLLRNYKPAVPDYDISSAFDVILGLFRGSRVPARGAASISSSAIAETVSAQDAQNFS